MPRTLCCVWGIFFSLSNYYKKSSMEILNSPNDFLYNLHTCSPTEAKKMWKNSIKEKWNHACAYCGKNDHELSIDHIVPQTFGGNDHITNVVCSCVKCNRSKSHQKLENWYFNQDFFTKERYDAILRWQNQLNSQTLFKYKPRRNNVSV